MWRQVLSSTPLFMATASDIPKLSSSQVYSNPFKRHTCEKRDRLPPASIAVPAAAAVIGRGGGGGVSRGGAGAGAGAPQGYDVNP